MFDAIREFFIEIKDFVNLAVSTIFTAGSGVSLVYLILSILGLQKADGKKERKEAMVKVIIAAIGLALFTVILLLNQFANLFVL